MYLTRFETAQDYYARAGAYLLLNEAEHNLVLGLTMTLIQHPHLYPEHPYLAIVECDDATEVAALRTPPHNLIITAARHGEALELIARDAYMLYRTLPGMLAPADTAREFAQLWQDVSSQQARLDVSERLYMLTAVNPVNGVPGGLRPAEPRDRELLIAWLMAFHEEALTAIERTQAERTVDNALALSGRGYFVWEDGGLPLAFLGYTGVTPNGVRIGPVYTPPENRGRGYGSAATAALSQLLLDQGRKFCTLYADLSNPTSNHIYQNIGYVPLQDVEVYRFVDGD